MSFFMPPSTKLSGDISRQYVKMLSREKHRKEYYIIAHPKVWSGYWYIRHKNWVLRRLGRKLHSRRIYWLGLNVEWVDGMKDILADYYKDKQ